MNIMGHNLIISDYNKYMDKMGLAYICCNCNAEITQFNMNGEMLIWSNHQYIELMSCSEYLIKNILE